MTQDISTLTFLPWLRRGIATGITGSSSDPGRAAFDVVVGFDNGREASTRLALYGPGEVAGINPRSIIRTYPQHDIHDAECNYFPLIEFDQPDFPWRYTPAVPFQNRLNPWLVLIALTDGEIDHKEPAGPDGRLPWIQVADADCLPSLIQSWAWAHVQIADLDTGAGETVPQIVEQAPERTISRLLCPRLLRPHTAYTVFLVPAFNRGRLSGLGENIGTDDVRFHSGQPAWWQGETDIKIPVYYQWRFQTGTAGDFESLARQLLPPKTLPPGVGRRQMDVSAPSHNLPAAADAPMPLEGALVSPAEPEEPTPQDSAFTKALYEQLNAPTAMLADGKTKKVVAPPLYGRWHAAKDSIPSGDHPWFTALNSELPYRAIAGLGTQVVQKRQQEIMAEAWDQVEQVEEINRELREAQLATALSQRLHERHFESQDVVSLLAITESLHGQVAGETQTVRESLRQNPPARGLLEGQFRRICRPLGPIRSRQRRLPDMEPDTSTMPDQARAPQSAGTAATQESSLLSGLLQGDITYPKSGGKMQSAASFSDAADQLQSDDTSNSAILALLEGLRIGKPRGADLLQAPVNTGFQPTGTGSPEEELNKKRQDLALIFDSISQQNPVTTTTDSETSTPVTPALEALRDDILAATDPVQTILLPLSERLTTADWVEWDPVARPGEQVMAAPVIDWPMYRQLSEISQEWLLPSANLIQPNTISLLQTNQRFIESFMAGLNHEMARELLWHEYPTDQRGTCFRQFWDTSGYMGSPPEGGLTDILPMDQWGDTALGENASRKASDDGQLVLLIRGDLLRHYPNAIIYAQRAILKDDNGPPVSNGGIRMEAEEEDARKGPLFFGRLPSDIFFAGFDIDRQQARGDDQSTSQKMQGWYFVLQEQPCEPRFGLDAAGEALGEDLDLPNTWRDLSWGHLVEDADQLQAQTYINLAQLPDDRIPDDQQGAEWHMDGGALSSDLAFITLQTPFRVIIHGSDMLPPE